MAKKKIVIADNLSHQIKELNQDLIFLIKRDIQFLKTQPPSLKNTETIQTYLEILIKLDSHEKKEKEATAELSNLSDQDLVVEASKAIKIFKSKTLK